ncbi:capsule assembly Wzi family protein [Marinoscillum sp. MHG1-6]|uniref:capsule assembly Wzi family protein n=1 Tax=Marinoscillum sp. MHG1-6 TaxID=2959627 RepID=UPI0021570877|nr:capsule assembly Wzi family protein [Marinoscillum sp. MHG1-6]
MRYFFLFVFSIWVFSSKAQDTDLPLNTYSYGLFSDWDIQAESNYFTTVKPISRRQLAKGILAKKALNDESDSFELGYASLESREYLDSVPPNSPALWGQLYEYHSDFYSHSSKDFDLHVNPVIVFEGGKENRTKDLLFQNYRGLEIRGTIDEKVSFYTLLNENQARYPHYVRNVTDSTLGVPYEGFWKQYNVTGIDFLRAQGFINFDISRHINAQFGYGNHFIGNGRRSLILSDFGNNYPYLRLQTKIWKFQYTNIFAQLTAETAGGSFGLLGTGSFPRKYLALHHLDLSVSDKLNIGLFESVIFGRPDSLGNGYRLEYLNPVIFYRALEQQDGSSDNAIIGLDFKWNPLRRISLYGQLVIDELIISKALSGDGYWENKQGFQLGIKYPDAFGIKTLHLQAEWNQVRPYTYAHQNNYTSYSHYNLPLAHPLGANFKEVLFVANYRPIDRLEIESQFLLAQYGNDFDSLSYGKNILKSYGLKTGEINIDLLQGNKTNLVLFQTRASYQCYHNLFIDLLFIYRKERFALGLQDFQSQIFTAGIRYNFGWRDYIF